MVIKIGFNIIKGVLVWLMFFLKLFGFKFYRDFFWYIGVMVIVVVVGFLVSIVNFIYFGLVWYEIIICVLDLIMIVVLLVLLVILIIGIIFVVCWFKR